jgi:hypothetical protein
MAILGSRRTLGAGDVVFVGSSVIMLVDMSLAALEMIDGYECGGFEVPFIGSSLRDELQIQKPHYADIKASVPLIPKFALCLPEGRTSESDASLRLNNVSVRRWITRFSWK